MKKTLYEIIKGMTIEEMAEYLCRFDCKHGERCNESCMDNCPVKHNDFVGLLEIKLEQQE